MLKEKLTSMIAGIILREVRNPQCKGRLTQISDVCRINRREFNVRGLSKMKLHRLLRIIYALALVMTPSQFERMMSEVRNTIVDLADEVDEAFFYE
jgi:hypothetical protein